MEREEYICLINCEEQYSLWLAHKAIPNGWSKVGVEGSKNECLAYIRKIWVDMRPKSLRKVSEQKVSAL